MSTSGRSAWEKYYQGNGDVETITKKEAELSTGSIKITIPKGELLTVLEASDYSSNTRVLHNGTVYTMSFYKLKKPTQIKSIDLSPNGLELTGKYLTVTEYLSKIVKSVDKIDAKNEVKLYLKELIDYYDGNWNAPKSFSNNLPILTIEKQFGETLGPLGILSTSLVPSISISDAKIYFPPDVHEPLVDYKILNEGKEYRFSAKTKKSTGNTIKAKDVLSLLSNDAYTKWKDTKQEKLLLGLSEGSVLTAPFIALEKLGFITEETLNYLVWAASKGKSFSEFDSSCIQWLKSRNKYLSELDRNPSINELMYAAERYLVELSNKEEFSLSEIFKDAIKDNVHYIKFSIDKEGKPNFSIEDLEYKTIKLRSKNSFNRKSDRLGLHV